MAKKDVAGMVAGAGLLTGIFTEFAQAVYERGGTDEDIHRLATPEGRAIIGQWADLTVRNSTAASTYLLAVDYSRTLAEVVTAGNYSYANDSITEENFPTDKGRLQAAEAILLHPNLLAESDEVLGELERMGLRPGTMFELAHFGEQYPEVQRQFPVIALGSVWTSPDGDRYVGYLWQDGNDRKLRLRCYDARLGSGCRFLAFPE